MKTIVFSYFLSACKKPGKYIDLADHKSDADIDHRLEKIELTDLFKKNGDKWFEQFSVWLGKLNCHHTDLFWWAHTATAKNLLSSKLGQHYFQIQAIYDVIKNNNTNHLYVLGATPGQMASIRLLLPKNEFQLTGLAWRFRHLHKWINNIKALLIALLQVGNVFKEFFNYRISKQTSCPDICFFTYMDGVRRDGTDNYFGKLPEKLHEKNQSLSFFYLAYVYRPYQYRLKQLLKERLVTPYLALYGFLRIKDYVWVIYHGLREWWFNTGFNQKQYQTSQEYAVLLREIFINEIGGYFHNLLVHQATRNFTKKYMPKVIVYPFENKSLEKMLLLGVKSLQSHIKTIGYQHTSITPRHSTFIFRPGEASYTPLPEKIITVGKITKDYLEKKGNYPPKIFAIGGALRQEWSERLLQSNTQNLRVLLALSSSKAELIQSIKFFQAVMDYIPDLELGIRPHINFPFSLLSKKSNKWVQEKVLNLSNSLLNDNLNWCTLTAYVSSTVALESLMRGKPVVHFSIGDIVSPDPLIGEVPFHWVVKNPQEMVEALIKIQQMSGNQYENESLNAISYVKDYLIPVDDLSLKNFSSILT